jgi:hypothetical protein
MPTTPMPTIQPARPKDPFGIAIRIVRLAACISALSVLASPAMGTKIPEDVKKVVCFVYVPDAHGDPTPNGTGFFVFVKLTASPDMAQFYLVSAKHVFTDQATGKFYPRFWVRVNRFHGGAELVKIELSDPDLQVYRHPTDNTVDIVVLPVIINQTIYDYKAVPEDMLTSREEFHQLRIAEGSDVFFTGLFVSFQGQQKNYPIVRFGRVAMVTEEKVPWSEPGARDPVLLDLYLIETMSFGGNSGAPVFFYLGADREPGILNAGAPVLKLAGIMKGSFDQRNPIGILQTNAIAVSQENIGIAAVVPAYLLHEILFSDRVIASRETRR